MRVTIKIDSATEAEMSALQQAMHAACGPSEIGGMSPHHIIAGSDAQSPTAIYAWRCGVAWNASTPPVGGKYGVDMLSELATRLKTLWEPAKPAPWQMGDGPVANDPSRFTS